MISVFYGALLASAYLFSLVDPMAGLLMVPTCVEINQCFRLYVGRLQFDFHAGADVPLGDDRGGAQLVHLLPAGRRDVECLGLR